ncbi:MAG: tetratricopeptide repeat protein [Acidobacteria bacterium]|nr:tetratricopeptide repeat protein [Acidobacteriota bacterium]
MLRTSSTESNTPPPTSPVSSQVIVGRWDFDVDDGTLRSGSELVRLEPRVAQVLHTLVRHAGKVLSRDDLMEEVWGDIHVAPIAVSRCISQLRSALGDTNTPRRYIETLPKRGYRLKARVGRPSPADQDIAPKRRPRRLRLLAGVAIVLASAATTWILSTDRATTELPVARASSTADVDDIVTRAQEYYDRQQYQDNENAVVLFEQAVTLDPAHSNARAGLANAYAKRARYTGHDARWIERAEAEARRAVAIDRLNPRAHKALGLSLSTRGALSGAAAAYRQAVKLNPDYGTALANLGVVLHEIGRSDEALIYALRAIEHGAPSVTSVDNVGDILDVLGLQARSEIWRAWAQRLEPNRVGTVVGLAYNDIYDGRPDDARARIAKLDSVVPDCRSCLTLRGDIEFLTGNVQAAEPYVMAAHALNPEGRLANIRLATVLAETDPRRAEAILAGIEAEVRGYIDGGADWWAGPWALAMVYALRQDRDATLHWFERTIDAGRIEYRFDSRDPRYAFLKGDPAFEALIQRQRDRVDELRNTVLESGVLEQFPEPPSPPSTQR